MEYIVCKTYEKRGLVLERGELVENIDHTLYKGKTQLCYDTSYNAYHHFARNDDGKGLERFELCEQIVSRISELVVEYNENYGRIVGSFTENTTDDEKVNALATLVDTVGEAYRKIKVVIPNGLKDGDNLCFGFYNAEIEQLEQVLRVI